MLSVDTAQYDTTWWYCGTLLQTADLRLNDVRRRTATITHDEPAGKDNCAVVSTKKAAASLGAGATFPVGATPESYTTTDTADLEATCSFDVTVVDNEAPNSLEIDGGPAKVTLSPLLERTMPALMSAWPHLNLQHKTTVVPAHTSGDTFALGRTTVTMTYQDSSSNAATCTFTVEMVSIGFCAGPRIELESAGDFAILSKSGVTTTGVTSVTGDMGTSPIAHTALTGFALNLDGSTTHSTSHLVSGNVYAADYWVPTPSAMTTAVHHMEAAFTDAVGRPYPNDVELGAGNLSGMTLIASLLFDW
jgi:hypothetical protein